MIGYARVEVYGFAPERFINLIIKNEAISAKNKHEIKAFGKIWYAVFYKK